MRGASREISEDVSAKKDEDDNVEKDEKEVINALAKVAAGGDTEALKHLLEHPYFRYRLREICKYFAWRYNSDPEVLEALEQEAYERIWKRIATFKSESSFETWVSRLARNLLVDILRKQNRRKKNDKAQEESAEREQFQRGFSEQRIIVSIDLQETVSKLPDVDQRILELRLMGHKIKEIGLMVHLSPSQTHKRLKRVLQRLVGMVYDPLP